MAQDDDMDGEVLDIAERGEEGRTVLRPPRKRSAPHPKDGTSRLRSLQCFPKVDELVRAGVFARTIAEFIQDEASEYLDVSFEAVVRAVRRYREQLENAGVRAAQEVAANQDDESDPLFELHEMRRNYKLLKERIDMEVATEKQLNKLFSTTHKEFGEGRELLAQILEEKRKLGIIGKDMTAKQRQSLIGSMAGRLDYASALDKPESRQKVIQVVEMLLGDPKLLESVANDTRVLDVPVAQESEVPTQKVRRARRHKGRKAAIRKNG